MAIPTTRRQIAVEYQFAAKKRSQKRRGREIRAASFSSEGDRVGESAQRAFHESDVGITKEC